MQKWGFLDCKKHPTSTKVEINKIYKMKYEGIIGVYPNPNPAYKNDFMVSLLKGDTGAPLSSLLPKDLKNILLEKKDITDEMVDFLKVIPYWLCDTSQMDKQYKKAAKVQTLGPKGEVKINPPFDLEVLKLILPDGSVDTDRMIQLFQIVGKCWKISTPKMGVICELVNLGWDLDTLEEVLLRFVKCDEEVFLSASENADIIKMFVPPECRYGNRLLKKGETEKAMSWYLRPQDKDSLDKNFFNVLSLMELQILDSNKKVNKSLVDRASNFVWTHEDEKPDFFKLKEYLSQFWKKLKVSQPQPEKIPKSTLQKLKKLKRKKGKIRRKKK